MRAILGLLLIVGYIIFRNSEAPLKLIRSGNYINNTFYNCTNSSNYFDAPTNLSIQSDGIARLELVNRYNKTIKVYMIKPMIKYWINLTAAYSTINDQCSILIHNNDSNHGIIIKHRYFYLPFWKYVVYLAEKHLENDDFLLF